MRKQILLNSLILFFLSIAFNVKAQTKEIQLTVGDSLTLGPCTGENFQYANIDILVKTRFPNPDATYNKETGEGFYNWYFTGDIDSKRLNCTYQKMKFRIAAIHTYPNENGSTRTVVLGQFINEATVLWVEINDAIKTGEVTQ